MKLKAEPLGVTDTSEGMMLALANEDNAKLASAAKEILFIQYSSSKEEIRSLAGAIEEVYTRTGPLRQSFV